MIRKGYKALRLGFVLASLCLAAGAGPSEASPPPRGKQRMDNRRPVQKYVQKACGTLGVLYVPTVNGCKVVGIMPSGVVPFADGSTLEVGDLIVHVGGQSTRGTAVDLQDKTDLAYANGNTEVLVKDVNTGNVFSFDLP